MNWAWASSLDQIWLSPALPIWMTAAAVIGFALILLFVLVRSGVSAGGALLTICTFVVLMLAVGATVRSLGGGGGSADHTVAGATSPALACLDELAGDVVQSACERIVFASPESTASAVSYAAGQISRLAAYGDGAATAKSPDIVALRRALERDRYGLVAYVLVNRDGCSPSKCAFYSLLGDKNQIVMRMSTQTYDGMVAKYSPRWTEPAAAPVAVELRSAMPVAAAPAQAPAAPRPLSGDFPSSASIPPVNIMAPEPPTASAGVTDKPAPKPPVNARAAAPATASITNPAGAPAPSAPKPVAHSAPGTAAAGTGAPSTTPAGAPKTTTAAKKPPAKKPPSTAPAPAPVAPPSATDDN